MSTDPYVGTILAGRYRVIKALGSGGMGTVYRAEHVHMKKAVAIKVLHKHMTAMPEVVARFEREAVAAGRIEHPNVAGATDFGQLDDGSFYLVLEYIEGKSLHALLASDGTLPVVRALAITRQIADGLAAAHAVGIIHRDLKPDNVMLIDRDGMSEWVKVLDFGIAKVPVEDAQKLTQIGTIFGTPQYMSPEQGQGHAVDHRSDLYALGVMLYEMLSGQLPFVADDLVVLITRHITELPPPLPAGIHPDVRDLVLELLEKDPEHRIQSAADLVARIDRLFKNPAIAPVGSIPPAALPSGAPENLAHARTALGTPAAGFDGRLLVLKAQRALRFGLPAALRRVHRTLLRPVRFRRYELSGYLIAGAVAIALMPPLVFVLVRDGGETAERERAAGGTEAAKDVVRVESAEDKRAKLIARAEGGDAKALAEIEAVPTRERRAGEWRALARGRCAAGERAPCAAAYKAAILAAPTLKKDPVVLADVRSLAEDAVVYEEAMRLAAHHLGEPGVDILFSVWTATRSQKDAQAVNRRARQFLEDGSVRNHASRELRIVLDLERAEKKRRCKDVPELVKKAAEYGDERAVPVLDRFAVGRGCGVFGLGDCWSCLRGNKDLATARAAAADRKGPSWNGASD